MTSGHSAFTNGGSRHVEGLGRSRSTIRAEFKSNGSPKPGGSSEHSSTCAKFLLYLTASPSLYALFAGIVTLAGWFWQWRQLTDWNNSGISMFANTALAAMCAGLAILMRLLQRPWASTMSSGLGALVAIIGCLTLFEHLSGINLGIDTLIITPKWGERAAVSSGRMGPPASTCFTLLGVALVLAANNWRARRAVPALGVIVIAISLLPVIGYLFDADPLFALARLTGIAMQT
ncbi:MAG TPA: hypothetical protein VJ063_08405, partial [Verrucomicrobiae bacterium]|nr:hypothetical protein [Verrucomicrobiae bacterium]